jgi:PAS domain S-box-containing protein
VLAVVARDALLHQLGRGNARQALQLALSALAAALGRPCGLQALDAQGTPRWHCGPCTGLALPLRELGLLQGRLYLPQGLPGAAAPPLEADAAAQAAAALADLLPTLAALLQRDALDSASDGRPDTHALLLRAALAGTDTFAWEWRLDNDWLGDIDEGLRLLGYGPDEVGHTQADWNRLIHPDDLEANDAAFWRHARGEAEIYESAYRARHKNGQWRWMLERGRVVERDAQGQPLRVVGTQVDVTERREAERQAQAAVQRLEQIASQVPGMLFMYELQRGGGGLLRYASARGPALFGLPPVAVQQDMQAIWDLIPEDDRLRMYEAFSLSARTLCDWTCDFRVQRPDGVWRNMSARATPERIAADLTRWYGYIEDVTERVELEQARREAASASAANRAKTEFLSRMSHELRTPLNAVLGFTQLIEIDRSDPASPGQLRRLALVREAGEHLLRMIGDLLDLTRIESGGLALAPEPLAVHPLAAQTLEMMRSAALAAQVQLLLQPGGEALLARADRTRLRQVLLNLLSNAIKYNRPGGRVELQVRAQGPAHVLVAVSDTGLGIAPDQLSRVFEPFERGAQAHGPVEGAGIGLAVTQALVAMMQGRIEVSSRPGLGSSFRVLLPRVGAATAQPPT